MSNDFRMPSLGPDMESGKLVEWRVKPGDAVKRGDVVALIETDKGVIDVEIFTDGVVEKLVVEEGVHVPVGAVLARLSAAGAPQELPESSVPQPVREGRDEALQAPAAPIGQREVSGAAAPPARVIAHPKISPAARTRARALGVDPASVVGTGPGGVVTLADVLKHASAAASAAPTPAPAEPPPRDMRQVIGRAMSRSKREIPHYYLALTCSFLTARRWIDAHNASVSIEQRLLPSALLLKAVALAARAMPDFNGFYTAQGFSSSADVHVGMAIAMRGGRLTAPAILNADSKTLATVMQELRDLTTRVRSGHMRGSELALSTITVTALAEEGVDLIVPVIYPPQVAIIGCGSIQERPWVIDGAVQAAPVVTLSLAADHRVSDGRAGARFLAHIRDALQAPERL